MLNNSQRPELRRNSETMLAYTPRVRSDEHSQLEALFARLATVPKLRKTAVRDWRDGGRR